MDRLSAAGVILEADDRLFAHGGDDCDCDFTVLLVCGADLLGELDVLWQVEVLLHGAVVEHEGELVTVDVHDLVLGALHDDALHVVGAGADFFVLLGVEDVEADDVRLGVAVLAGLAG